MPKWLRTLALPVVALGLVAAACSSDDSSTASGTSGSAAAECSSDIKVGVALDVGGIGDKSFNDAANRGVQNAIADGLVCQENVKLIEANATGSNRDANVQALADAGYDLIVGVGFAFSEGVAGIAGDYPDQNFAVVDGYANAVDDKLTNVADLTFKEQEGSFLVGAAAATWADNNDCDTVGFLGGQTGPLIGKFEAGYTAGVHAVDKNITVLVEYIGDDVTAFNDPTKGEALSTKMYDDGACVIYHASGASGAGLFTAAVKADKLAIGVDSDQYLTASAEQQPLILTSMLKRVDTAVYDAIKQTNEGNFTTGFQSFGLAEDGVDYSTSNAELMTEDIQTVLDEYKQQIIAGDIVVPEEPES
jgi:basic membrane protein A